MFKAIGHDLRLVLVSVLASSVVVAVPASAAVYVANADKVDNKHAVASGATVNARKGKLVATNPTTGRLPNNIITKAGDSDRLDGLHASAFLRAAGKAADADRLDGLHANAFMPATQLAPGATLRGFWFLEVETPGTGDWATSVSYPVALGSEPVAHFVPMGPPTSECPGSSSSPAAAPGHLCVYVDGGPSGTISAPLIVSREYGFGVRFTDDGVAGDLWAHGNWAVTAPTS